MVVCACVVASACARNPVTGKRQLALISERQEIELGQQARPEIAASVGLYPDKELQGYVARVGMALAKDSERPGIPWSFEVLDDASVNAFALPGGPVFITRGLLTHLNSEAELAGVLGHEIGHITARHTVSLLSKQQLAQLGLGVGSVLLPERLRGLGDVAGAGAGLLFLRYGRDAERQSDELAWEYSLKNGYDVRELKDVFQTLARASEGSPAGRVPQWLSTHPEPQARVAAIEERLKKQPPPPAERLERREDAFMARLQGVVVGQNPRQGFFEGSAFLHPDLEFQVQFPSGWQAINEAQAVTAVSPRQDAMIQLGVVSKLRAEQAAQQFFSQRGIQRGALEAGTVNALPAVAGYFQAQTEQGVLAGLTAFVEHGGSTYQLIGFTGAQSLPAYDDAFRQSISSFGELTDPRALSREPARLEVVKLPSAMTLEEAHAKYPSTADLSQVALLNGVQAGATLPAGSHFKRVVGGAPVESTTPTARAAE